MLAGRSGWARHWPVVALALGLAAILGVLATTPYLPFQDVPNHLRGLQLARALRAGATSDYFVLPGRMVFAYSLHVRIDELLAPLLSADATIRLVIMLGALLPLAVAFLARRLGASATWAGVLALPTALSWPVQMGFLAYALGLPFVFVAAALAIDACDPARSDRRRGLAAVGVAVALALGYLAQPMVLLLAGLVVGLVALTPATPRLRSLALLAGSALPALALLAYDLAHQAYAAVPGIDAARWDGHPQPPGLAKAVGQFFMLGVDARTVDDLLWRGAPFLALVALVTLGFARPPAVGGRAGTFTAVALVALLTLGLFTPTELPGASFVVERLPPLALAFAAIPAAWAAARARPAVQLAVLATVVLAVGSAVRAVQIGSGNVAAIVGAQPPHTLAGRVTMLRVNCAYAGEEMPFRSYIDPFYHVWAYALDLTRGTTAYQFASRRYTPIWFRDDFGEIGPGPEVELLSRNPDACESALRGALQRELSRTEALRAEGVLVESAPPMIDRLLEVGRGRMRSGWGRGWRTFPDRRRRRREPGAGERGRRQPRRPGQVVVVQGRAGGENRESAQAQLAFRSPRHPARDPRQEPQRRGAQEHARGPHHRRSGEVDPRGRIRRPDEAPHQEVVHQPVSVPRQKRDEERGEDPHEDQPADPGATHADEERQEEQRR